MANPLWKAGMKPVNPLGRPKNSVTTPAGMLERFVKRHITPNKLKVLFDKLTANQQADFLIQTMPYIMAKKMPDSISSNEVDELYEKLERAINDKNNQNEKFG